ncbi:MAG: hypothetical protein AAF125_25260 [Chloroflexota bacterium]
MQKRLLPLLAMVIMAAPLALYSIVAQDDAPETPTVEDALAAFTWIDVDHIEMTETDDAEMMLAVYYVSREFNLVAYRSEMLEIFRVVGTLELGDDVDRVRLVPMADMGAGPQGIETATIDLDTLLTYATGETTRTDFLEVAVIAPLEHGDGEEQVAPA